MKLRKRPRCKRPPWRRWWTNTIDTAIIAALIALAILISA